MTSCLRPDDQWLSDRADSLGIVFDPALPVSAAWREIARALLANPVLIVCGETGSGKTTQLPKIALAAGRAAKGRSIAHTQPRRLAATSVARRVAQELKSAIGEATSKVGYKIRFADRSRPGIPIKLMTDGILLAEIQSDPMLRAYDTVILDEAHERSLNIDFLLGHLHGLLPRRPDLRLIITSASLEAEKFARHFGRDGIAAPVMEVSGRAYPVEIVWRVPQDDREDLIDRVLGGVEAALLDTSLVAARDVLVFLPGEREIRAVVDAWRDRRLDAAVELLPLFGRLAQADQERVFRPGGRRRVVLATNLAETSLTVPGIGYVVDSGLARVKRYRYRGKVEQLLIEPISQAQALQRAGRAGRLAPGVCIRLYSEEDFRGRPAHPEPEIYRSSLASVILRMKALGLDAIEAFPFVDPPSKKAIADGVMLLRELGGLGRDGELTAIGRQLAALPLDPRLGRMLVAGHQGQCLREMIILVCAMSIQDPRDRPLDQQAAADTAHKRFADPRSEFTSWLNLWAFCESALSHDHSNRQKDQQLRSAFLSPIRVREWRDLHRQITDWVLSQEWRINTIDADYMRLHQAILTGLLSNIGMRMEAAQPPVWQGAHDVKFSIWPGSHLSKKPPTWLMAAEQVETSRLFARTIAAIEPQWIEQIAGSLIRVSYADPHWEKKAGRAVGYARGVLYGLAIFQRRRIAWAQLGPSQASEARTIMIREGLVGGDARSLELAFFEHNRRLMQEVELLEQRARRQDLLVDEGLIEAFYDRWIPQEVCDFDGLRNWWRAAVRDQPSLLFLKRADLMRHQAEGVTTEAFPSVLEQGGIRLAVGYRFEPGSQDDGMSVTIPLASLNQVDVVRLDWLVPGMLKEKVTALVKSLPQRIRRHCIPLPDYVEAFCGRWHDRPGEMPLRKALAQDLREAKGLAVALDDFKLESIPPHLQPFYVVLDEHGRRLGQGRDVMALREQLGGQALAAFAPARDATGYREWSFGPLEWPMTLSVAGQSLLGYPALEDCADHVTLTVLDDPNKAKQMHRLGLMRLLVLALKDQVRSFQKDLERNRALLLAWTAASRSEDLQTELLRLSLRRSFLAGQWPGDAAAFDACLQAGRPRFLLIAQEAQRWLLAVLEAHQQIQRRLSGVKYPQPLLNDISQQLAALLYKHVVSELADERARHLPRYLQAVALRLDKHRTDPARDALRLADFDRISKPFWRWAAANRGEWSEPVEEFRWMLEELRVSLFAEGLKTAVPVSVKRLEKTWGNLAPHLHT